MDEILIPPALRSALRRRVILRLGLAVLLALGCGAIYLFATDWYSGLSGNNLTLFYLALLALPILLPGLWRGITCRPWHGVVTAIRKKPFFDEKKRALNRFTLTLCNENGKAFEKSYVLPQSYFNGPQLYEIGNHLYGFGGGKKLLIYCLPTHVNDPLRCVLCGKYYAPDIAVCKRCGKPLIQPLIAPTLPARKRHGELRDETPLETK